MRTAWIDRVYETRFVDPLPPLAIEHNRDRDYINHTRRVRWLARRLQKLEFGTRRWRRTASRLERA